MQPLVILGKQLPARHAPAATRTSPCAEGKRSARCLAGAGGGTRRRYEMGEKSDGRAEEGGGPVSHTAPEHWSRAATVKGRAALANMMRNALGLAQDSSPSWVASGHLPPPPRRTTVSKERKKQFVYAQGGREATGCALGGGQQVCATKYSLCRRR